MGTKDTNTVHVPVLVDEVIEGLNLKEGDRVFEGTGGSGGHSKEICKKIGKTGTIVITDLDKNATERIKKNLTDESCRVEVVEENFRNLDKVLENLEIKEVDAVLFDLGFSSDQLEESGRGFSFEGAEPLVMTYKVEVDPTDITAKRILNDWKEEDIANVLYGYGNETMARKIAEAIVKERKTKKFETTEDLTRLINETFPHWKKKGRIHPATKTFQALRIAVNNELEALKEGLSKGWQVLNVGGKMAVISFHEGEDRIVKNFFRNLKKDNRAQVLTKKPTVASREELRQNPRARSAKLRIAEKL